MVNNDDCVKMYRLTQQNKGRFMNTILVTVQNNSDQKLYVSGDPNWDDQQLVVNGEVLNSSVALEQNEVVVISMDWDSNERSDFMLGLLVSETKFAENNSWQMTLGENAKTTLLDVTDSNELGSPKEIYQVSDETEWSLTLSLYPKVS